MGDMLRAKGENTSAAAEYRKATAVAPGFLAAHLGLARAFYSDHRAEEAEQEVRLVLAANPEDAEANYLMGEILVNGPAPAEALAYLQKALHVSPEERPYVHADLSKAYEEQGNRSLAIAELKQAVAIDGDGSYTTAWAGSIFPPEIERRRKRPWNNRRSCGTPQTLLLCSGSNSVASDAYRASSTGVQAWCRLC